MHAIVLGVDDDGAAVADGVQVASGNPGVPIPTGSPSLTERQLLVGAGVGDVHRLGGAIGIQPPDHTQVGQQSRHQPTDALEHHLVRARLQDQRRRVEETQPAGHRVGGAALLDDAT